MHVTSALVYKRVKLEDHCDDYYSLLIYQKVYNETIEKKQILIPPPLKRKPDWPKKNRKRPIGKELVGTSKNRSFTIKCAICKQFGHNKSSC